MTDATTPRTVVRRSTWRVAHLDATLSADLAEALWRRPEGLLAACKPLRAVGVRRTVELIHGQQHFVLKHYVEPSTRHALKQLVQPSRAWKAWRMAHWLADAGVATPRPVACIEGRWGPLRRDSYLMYPYVPGRRLIAYVTGREASTPELFQRMRVQLDELWGQLAQLRASLGDANLGNFIVSPAGRLWVIDLDKARIHFFANAAARHQKLRWKQVLRTATKHGRLDLTAGAA